MLIRIQGTQSTKNNQANSAGKTARLIYIGSVTEAANALGVARKTLSAILNGRSGISPGMAIRLGKAFDTSPESWLNQQVQYDLWEAGKQFKKMRVKKLVAAK